MRQLTQEELKTIYPALFKEIFGFWNENELPRIVIVQEDEDKTFRGFMSGYMLTKNAFYMAWGGLKPGLTFKGTKQYWEDGEDWFRKKGVKLFETKVDCNNTQWQRVILGMGWVPHGVHFANGRLYIEYHKEL